MPALSDPRHEAVAQGLAKGLSADKAYAQAGYKPDRGNASRLTSKDSVIARVKELQEVTAQRVIDASIFEAKQMFADLLQDIVDAKRAGDHKTAIDGRKFLLRCFGYEDSPTLTHEHVKGKKLAETPADAQGEASSPEPARSTGQNVTDFSKALKQLRSISRKVG